MIPIALLTACLDITNCELAGDCTPYRPEGVLCGLSRRGFYDVDHTGSSCRTEVGATWYDPGWQNLAIGVRTARPETDRPCPEDVPPETFGDHDAMGTWAWCPVPRTDAIAPKRLRDLPEGAVCGLGGFGDTPVYCDGYQTNKLECPPGWTLRWIPDQYVDGFNESCRSDRSPVSAGFDAITFCELDPPTTEADGGCLEADEQCRSLTMQEGLVCGLHAVPEPRGDGNLFGFDPRERLLLLQETCPTHYALSNDWDALERAIDDQPTCMGKPVSEGCPQGMEEACTHEWLAPTRKTLLSAILVPAWCWCTPIGGAHVLDGPPSEPPPPEE